MKSVLICEDNLERLEALVQAFSRAGYHTRASRDPEHALRQFHEASCDAVLCGADLREADPLELVQGLRNLGVDTPVLMIAQEATQALRERLREVGIRRLLDASAPPREWVRAVEEAIVERRRDPAAASAVLVHAADPELRRSLAHAIAASGLFVLEARDAAEARALTRARRPAPALAVVDLDDGGAALVGDLRAAAPGLYVAAVTRRPEPARLLAAYEAGAATVVRTSCPPSRLAGLLRANLDRARRSVRPSEAGNAASGRARGVALWRRPWRGVSALMLAASFAFGALLAAIQDTAPPEPADTMRHYILVPADVSTAPAASPFLVRSAR